MTTPKGGATTTTTAKQEVPAYVSAAQQNLLDQSNAVLGPQLQPQQYTQAGLNADQTGAYDLTRALTQNAFQNSGGSAANALALGRGFDSAAYLAANPDVKAAGMDPLQHYLQYGQTEGRQAPTAASSIAAPSLTNPANAAGVMAGVNAAQATTRDAVGQGYSPTMATAEQLDPTAYKAFLNPYTQDVVDTTTANMRRQYGQTAAGIGAKAAASGAFGGSRQALQSAQLDRSFGEQVATTTAQLMSAGFDKATASAMANAQMQQQTNLANASAANQASQFGAQAGNTASLANASASNSASQYNANAQNTRDQFNAGQALTSANSNNANELSRYGLDLNRYQAENSNANALAQLQEAMKTGDQTRQMQAIQALLSQGNAQQQFAQSNVTTPLQYLQLLSQITPTNYGGTNTTTAPNTAPSPLQSLLGAGVAIGSKFI